MPKQTRRYKAACKLAKKLNVLEQSNQKALYQLLNEEGYYWIAVRQAWVDLYQDTDPLFTELIEVRLWSETSKIQTVAYQLRIALENQGYQFLGQSEPRQCRAPKQLESRIYMTFK